MEKIYNAFYQLLGSVKLSFKRYLYDQIDWNDRLIAIVGARGSGKTTLMLQHIKESYGNAPKKALYVSLDHIWFTEHSLYDLADDFMKMGGEALFLDEVHKYNRWAQEIKNIYDSFPTLRIVFTGSSILKLYQGEADLSRRIAKYELWGMSFREYLEYVGLVKSSPIRLEDILNYHVDIAREITSDFKVLPAMSDYLSHGCYPYFKENVKFYHDRLCRTVDAVIETDLPCVEHIDYYAVDKIRKLLYIISNMVPFTPNISELSGRVGVSRSTLMAYLRYLQRAQVVILLEKNAQTMKQLVKPEKIYLANANLSYAFADKAPNDGAVRETFVCSQLSLMHSVQYSKVSDFLIDDTYTFEVGGKNKTNAQLSGVDNAYRLLDNVEVGFANAVPLWLMGWLY